MRQLRPQPRKQIVLAVVRQIGRAQHIAHQVVKLPIGLALGIFGQGQGLLQLGPSQFAIDQGREQLLCIYNIVFHGSTCCLRTARIPCYQRLPVWRSSIGLTRAEIASRARKMRERTVPIGQAMACAISS